METCSRSTKDDCSHFSCCCSQPCLEPAGPLNLLLPLVLLSMASQALHLVSKVQHLHLHLGQQPHPQHLVVVLLGHPLMPSLLGHQMLLAQATGGKLSGRNDNLTCCQLTAPMQCQTSIRTCGLFWMFEQLLTDLLTDFRLWVWGCMWLSRQAHAGMPCCSVLTLTCCVLLGHAFRSVKD